MRKLLVATIFLVAFVSTPQAPENVEPGQRRTPRNGAARRANEWERSGATNSVAACQTDTAGRSREGGPDVFGGN
jgi:hypothetical protein